MAPASALCRCLTRRRALLGVAVVLAPAAAQALDLASLQFDQLYKSFGVRGYEFSDTLLGLKGKPVVMRGYMAPPLKPEIDFFVLTSLPTAICPFCDAAASWPDDIVLVKLSRPVRALAYDILLNVSGTLEIGEETDAGTGFVSLVRLRDAKYSKV